MANKKVKHTVFALSMRMLLSFLDIETISAFKLTIVVIALGNGL